MSLDFYLEGPEEEASCECHCGHKHGRKIREHFIDANITHNLGPMAREAGIYEVLWEPKENGYQTANQIIPRLESGIAKLKAEPERFKRFNPGNGWGTYDGLVETASAILYACREHPTATISAWR